MLKNSPETFSNAWHPNDDYYNEWWYFTLLCDSGDIIAGNLKIKNKKPEVWLFLETKDGKPQYLEQEYRLEDFSAAKDCCRVKIGDSQIEQSGKNFSLRVKLKNFDLSVSFQSEVDWEDNILKKDMARKQKVFWIVPCLRGSFSGTLNDGKQIKEIKGIAFHDHVWHNIALTSTVFGFEEWLWGICYTKNSSFLFCNVRLSGENFSFLSFERNGKVESTNKEIDQKDIIWDKTNNSMEVKIRGESCLTVEIKKREKIPFSASNRLLNFFVNNVFCLGQNHCTLDCLIDKNQGKGYMETLFK